MQPLYFVQHPDGSHSVADPQPTLTPDEHEYEVRCAGDPIAWTSGTEHDGLREARHYAAVYAEDGPTEIYEVHKTYTLIK